MIDKSMMGAGLGLALLLPLAAQGAEDPELQRIRAEIRELRESYEARIRALEQRLEAARSHAAAAPADRGAAASAPSAPSTAAAPAGAAPASMAPAPSGRASSAPVAVAAPARGAYGRASSAGAFNPDISLILSGRYARTSRDPATWALTGFPLPEGIEGGPGERGFSLAESELGIGASIDPYLRGMLRLALAPDNSVAVEEANIQTTALGHGVSVKAGRFYSGIGYLNEQHPHYWDFVDAPLAYQAFLGRQFSDDGVQLRWVAPTDTFVEVGFEAGRGRAFPAAGQDGNGSGAQALHVHLGADAGVSNSWRAGVSVLRANARDQRTAALDLAGAEVVNAFTGRHTTWIADLVWRWAPGGDPSRRNFKLQAEYLRRTQAGELTYAVDGPAAADAYRAVQSGWYVQGVYQFMPRWRAGVRLDRVAAGSVALSANAANLATPSYDPRRYSLMLDYSPSEYSRFRIQLARDEARQGQPDHQIFLQYQTSLGAHGAHRF